MQIEHDNGIRRPYTSYDNHVAFLWEMKYSNCLTEAYFCLLLFLSN